MRALRQRFSTPYADEDMEFEQEEILQALRQGMDKPQRKLLLRLLDMESTMRDEAALNSFINGYRLANGIHRELTQVPPYSFDREEEELAVQTLIKKGALHGEKES